MREDVYIQQVIDKCEAFKKSNIWPPEPILRPRGWLQNFDDADKFIAATLLDKFNFYNEALTNRLLMSSYDSLGDHLFKGPRAPDQPTLVNALKNAVFTLVEGERPNVTDSGYNFCRKARQELFIPEVQFANNLDALSHAMTGGTVVFLDDFVGSGDQFITTWTRMHSTSNGISSFRATQSLNNFIAIYITLVTTDFGLKNINTCAPSVAVCATHILGEKNTYKGIKYKEKILTNEIESFLIKYSDKLNPREQYMHNPQYKAFGYKQRGLMFGFAHSIPDATLPIYWSPGFDENWRPLIERR